MGFLALTVIAMNITIFWNVISCSSVNKYEVLVSEETAVYIFWVEEDGGGRFVQKVATYRFNCKMSHFSGQ